MTITQPSILITDDDRQLRETLAGMFEPVGFRTFVAEDGPHALAIVEREPVHLVLLDMHMPNWTGLETLRRVKQINSALPCILMSAALDGLLTQQALLAQAFCVLSKPLSSRQLTASVDEALLRTYGWTPRPDSTEYRPNDR